MKYLFMICLLMGSMWGQSIELKWKASTSQNVKYRVYKAVKSTGPFIQIKSGITLLTYTDGNVVTKTTYWYKVNCRDQSTGLVSKFSNTVQVKMP